MIKTGHITISCALIFHSPDGSALLVQSDTIKIIRPVTGDMKRHLAPGTNSVLYAGVRGSGFGVRETSAEAVQMIKDCK